MKTLKKATLLLLLSALFATTAYAAEPQDYTLLVNGDQVEFDGETSPVILNGRTYLPLRFLFGKIAADGVVDWDEEAECVTLTRGERVVKLWIGSDKAEIDGEEVPTDAPVILSDRTYIPLRFVANAFDMTVAWDAASSTACISDNELLDKIIELMGGTSEVSEETPPISSDMIIDMNITVFSEGEEMSMQTKMEGTLEQDYAKKFQHIVMTTRSEGEGDITVETYDNGEAQYLVTEGGVLKTESAFSVADNIMAQYDLLSTLDLSREYYAGFKLVEEAERSVVSGNMFLPDEYFNDLFANMQGMGDLAEVMSSINLELVKPISYEVIIDNNTGLMTSMSMSYSFLMDLSVEDETISMAADYVVQIPRFVTGAEFETVVPAEITEAAIDLAAE